MYRLREADSVESSGSGSVITVETIFSSNTAANGGTVKMSGFVVTDSICKPCSHDTLRYEAYEFPCFTCSQFLG